MMLAQWNPGRLTIDETPSRLPALVILGLYAFLTLSVGLHHEPWRDEADSWLVVRDAPVITILSWTRNAGTPALWYLMLKPLVWTGLPFLCQQILHLALAWAAAAILLLRARFTWLAKILILFSYPFSYEYAVVARSYVLTVLLTFLIASWSHERRRPVRTALAVALLFNANVHGAVIAAVFGLLYLLEARRRPFSWPAVAVMLAGAVAAWAQLRPAPDSAFPQVIRAVRWSTLAEALAGGFLPGLPLVGAAAGAACLLLLTALALRRKGEAVLFLGLTLGGLGALYVWVWFGGYRHAGLLLLCLLVAIWMAGQFPRDAIASCAALVLHLTLGISVLFAVRMARADLRMDFSGGPEMGRRIKAQHLDHYEIAAHNMHECESVLPWIPGKQLWYAAIGRYGTYMHWNGEEEAGRRLSYAAATDRAVARFAASGQPWLLLLNAPMPSPEQHGFRLLLRTEGIVFRHRDERYWLYEWKGRFTR